MKSLLRCRITGAWPPALVTWSPCVISLLSTRRGCTVIVGEDSSSDPNVGGADRSVGVDSELRSHLRLVWWLFDVSKWTRREREVDVQRDLLARGRVANVNVKQCLEDGHGDTQFVYIYVRVSSFVWRIRVARVETESEIGKEGERRRRRRSVARKGGEAAKNFG